MDKVNEKPNVVGSGAGLDQNSNTFTSKCIIANPDVEKKSQPDLNEAQRFLDLLDPDAAFFTFQTFDDDKYRKDRTLTRILHGSLSQQRDVLVQLNAEGAGVFVTINKTDGRGRRKRNIIGVRAVFVDLDGAPLPPVQDAELKPHCIVESSPGRYHAYWLVDHCSPLAFGDLQTALAQRFNGDESVKSFNQVMRLPGFIHRKQTPFLSYIMEESA